MSLEICHRNARSGERAAQEDGGRAVPGAAQLALTVTVSLVQILTPLPVAHILKRISNDPFFFQFRLRDTHFLRGSRWTEPAGADQEGVGLGFAALDLGVVAQDHVAEAAEELLVLARLQPEGGPRRTGGHGDGDFVLLQVDHQFLHAFRVGGGTRVSEGH